MSRKLITQSNILISVEGAFLVPNYQTKLLIPVEFLIANIGPPVLTKIPVDIKMNVKDLF
jgi:hypothetical protein